MSISSFISEKLNVVGLVDDEGVYSYILEMNDTIGSLKQYNKGQKLNSSILLECDDNNFLSLKYFDEFENVIISIDGTKINAMEYIDDEYEDINGILNIEKALIFYSDTWSKRYLRVDLYPRVSVALEVDYDKYDTDEDGIIIWE